MTSSKARRLRKTFDRLWNSARGGIRSEEMTRFAESLGRRRTGAGKHPNWKSEAFPDLRTTSIPHHSTPLKFKTARSILAELEEDLIRLESASDPVDEDEETNNGEDD